MALAYAGRPRVLLTVLVLIGILFFPCPFSGLGLLAAERPPVPVSFQPGVLELGGGTGLSLNYQNESGGRRETTQLRITPSIGYFILPGFEIMLNASYILDIVRNADLGYRDQSDLFLFTLGPVYNVYQVSDRLVPYAGLLLGMYYQRLSGRIDGVSDTRSDLQLALGLETGIRWLLTENLALRTGFQYVHGFSDAEVGSTNYLGLMLGVSVFIPTWPSLAASKPLTP